MSVPVSEKLFARWADVVRTRVGEHPFAAPAEGSNDSPLNRLLAAIYRQHFHSPYAYVEPPLQGFPRLPLDHRWVELRVREDDGPWWLRQVRVDGQPIGPAGAVQSVHPLLNSTDCRTILGAPGSGKSTTLRWAAQYLIRESRLASIVPIYIPLRAFVRWQEQHPSGDLYSFVWLAQLGLPERHADEFREFMEDIEGGSGARRHLCRVLLDGWDEVPPARQAPLLQAIERFEHTLPALLTSRPAGFVSCLPPWTKCTIVPLTFEAMRALMREWYSRIGYGYLEGVTCRHLDGNLGLRELARNPFVLTLFCAVVARREGRLPTTRAELYRDAVALMAKYCDEHQRDHGRSFGAKLLGQTERVAYELLSAATGTSYEFTADEVEEKAGHNGTLFETWKAARLVSLANEFAGSFGFLHTTIHEYLAAQELSRRVEKGLLTPDTFGLNPAMLNVLTFAFGRLESTPQAKLWQWLRRACTGPDRFGLMFLWAARWLVEANERDGGLSRLGVDVREVLWGHFVVAESPRRYAEALVALDAAWTIGKAIETLEPGLSRTTFLFALLVSLVPVTNPARRRLVEHSMQKRQSTGPTVIETDESLDLVRELDCEPGEASSLTLAESTGSEAELIAEAHMASDPQRLRIALMRLAGLRTIGAEEFLTARLQAVSERRDFEDAAEALGELGTIGARDSLLQSLLANRKEPHRLLAALRALVKLPMDRDPERVLELVESNYPQAVRVAAALVLGNTETSSVLNKLATFARISEPEPEVRKACITALGRARAAGFVLILYREWTDGKRRSPDEHRLCIDYLGAIARNITATRDYANHFPNVEAMLLDAIGGADAIDPEVIARAAELRASQAIRGELRRIAVNARRADAERAAAVRALDEMDAGLSPEEVSGWLDESIRNREQPMRAQACASVLARTAPERLLARNDPPSIGALRRLSLDTETLVYADRLVSPAKGATLARSADGAQATPEVSPSDRPRSQRGRKRTYDWAADRRIADAWENGPLTTYAALARELRMTAKEVRKALDRVRGRKKRRG